MINNDILIDKIKKISYLPNKFNSENKIDKYIANFLVIINNYNNLRPGLDLDIILKNLKDYFNSLDDLQNSCKYIQISGFIYLSYNDFIKLNMLFNSFNIDEYYDLNKLLYKMFKHTGNNESIYSKLKYIDSLYFISKKYIKGLLLIFNIYIDSNFRKFLKDRTKNIYKFNMYFKAKNILHLNESKLNCSELDKDKDKIYKLKLFLQ